MSLSTAQLTVLKAAIASEVTPAFVLLRNEGATGAMADWYNQPSTFVVWKTNVQIRESDHARQPLDEAMRTKPQPTNPQRSPSWR